MKVKTIPSKTLTSREVARVLSVSDASVKRWADSGLLPTEKTVGGHRRFRPDDVAAFRRTTQARLAKARVRDASIEVPPHTAAPGQIKADQELAGMMFEQIVGGRDEEASAMVVGLHLHGYTAARIADLVICPALRKVGELWCAGELSVAQEHVATRAVLSALEPLRAAIGGGHTGNRLALCCSVEDDFHEVPIHTASLVLMEGGWEVVSLGTSTPFFALAEAVARFRPGMICVSSTVFNHPDRAGREYAEFAAAAKRAGASTVLGGAGFAAESVQRRFPADLHAETFLELERHAAATNCRKPLEVHLPRAT
ncbi:MAG TPA: helix-turn-helix domain-containing protein [Pyrinomonadaceae bacterium]|jgi:excisionase family DNA binding protein|nr:helix-turn-helix domain-containing protein [Pyrinomonadaceae bacterium]